MAFATHFRAREKYEKEDKNEEYFPADCKISMQLQTSTAVEKGPGFQDLARETEEIVVRCRNMLKKQHMKCVGMNVIELKNDITRKFAMALPKIAMLLLALELEDVEIASGHCCVADLLSHNRDATLSFLNVTNRDFAQIYCTEHALESFPAKSSPPLITNTPTPATPAQQGGVLALRGGNGDEDFLRSLDSEDARPHAQRAVTAIAQLNAGQHTSITPNRV